MSNKNFYHMGHFFEKEEDFWEHVNKWPEEIINYVSVECMMDLFRKDMQMNAFISQKNITNRKFREILNKTFEFYIEQLRKTYG